MVIYHKEMTKHKNLLIIMDTYGYIYITTNTINNKRYIGQHKSKDWDYKYFGSGLNLTRAITKHGIEKFTCFPLAWAWNKEELNQLEIDYIAHYKPEYNISKGGNGGNLGYEAIEKMRQAKIGKPSWNKGKRGLQKHTDKWKLEQSKRCKGNKNSFYGKHHTDEVKVKCGNSTRDKYWFTNGIVNIIAFECPAGFKKGRTINWNPWNKGKKSA